MTEALRVGTRRSPLARAQTDLVVRSLRGKHPGLRVAVCPMSTSGDRDRRIGASPDFTGAIDRAVTAGEVDLAVHSAKDLPVGPLDGLWIAATPRRADARDALVLRGAGRDHPLPHRARVGSSSPRRRAQLRRWRPDLDLVEIRGNVDSRLRRLRRGELDAAVLAVAGLDRLGVRASIARVLPTSDFLPAPAQGALAVVVRRNDRATGSLVAAIDHPSTRAAVEAERSFADRLGGDCRLPLAAYARVLGSRLVLEGEVLSVDGAKRFRSRAAGPPDDPARIGRELAELFRRQGADALLAGGSA